MLCSFFIRCITWTNKKITHKRVEFYNKYSKKKNTNVNDEQEISKNFDENQLDVELLTSQQQDEVEDSNI